MEEEKRKKQIDRLHVKIHVNLMSESKNETTYILTHTHTHLANVEKYVKNCFLAPSLQFSLAIQKKKNNLSVVRNDFVVLCAVLMNTRSFY